uniref:Uncharacterized protein n=1 Tax=Anopheles albimanus TaxID=7167 RepID=A0A182FE52_ANOAL
AHSSEARVSALFRPLSSIVLIDDTVAPSALPVPCLTEFGSLPSHCQRRTAAATMTSTATIPRGAPQTMVPPSLVLPSTLVVPRRSSVVNGGARSSAEVSPLGATGGGASDGRWSARKAIEPPSNHPTASLKTLSCDLSELLVRNLSLRRSETSERQPCQQQQQQPLVDKLEEQCCGSGVPLGSAGGGGTSNANRSSLCDTFPSVNKFIKLKRVSSDGSNLSRLSVVATTATGGNYTKIVEQPTTGARFKRVEISVRQGRTTPNSATSAGSGGGSEESKRGAPVNQRRTSGAGVQPSSSESDAEEEEEEEKEVYSVSGSSVACASTSSVRKSVIVNQLDQVDENCPLLVAAANGSKTGATVTLRKKDSSLVFTTRKPPVAAADGGSVGESTTVAAATSLRKEQAACSAVPKVVLRRRRQDRPGDREVVVIKRRSLPWPLGTGSLLSRASITEGTIEEGEETQQRSSLAQATGREKHSFSSKALRHSWNAPGYDILEEDPGGEDLQKDFASIIHNLAGLRNHHLANGTHESVSLLEQHSPQIVPSRATRPTSLGSGQGRRGGRPSSWMQSSPMVMVPPATIPVPTTGTGAAGAGTLTDSSSPHTGSLSAPVPRKRRFEAFLKNLVGRRPSKEPPSPAPPPPPPLPPAVLLPSPEIKISKSPSEHNLAELERSRLHVSTTSLSSVHQKLWSVVPLLKRDVSCNSLASPKTTPLLMFDGYQSATATGAKLTTGGTGKLAGPAGVGALRKCETVLALTGSSASQTLEPIRPLNRLRNCASVATCSRCSSLLSLAAAGSRYSLNASNGAFVPVASGPSELSSSQHQLPVAASRGLRKKAAPDAGTIPDGGGGGGGAGTKRKHVGNLLRLTSSTRRSSSSSSSSSSAASSPCSSSTPSSSSSSSASSSASTPNGGAGSPAASVSSKTAMFVPSPLAGSQLLIPVPALSGCSPVATNAAASTTTTTTTALTPTVKFTCKLCLGEYSAENLTRIAQCDCSFCTEVSPPGFVSVKSYQDNIQFGREISLSHFAYSLRAMAY